jgi:hypothetical protein
MYMSEITPTPPPVAAPRRGVALWAQIIVWAALQSRHVDLVHTLEAFKPIIDIARGYFGAAQRARKLPRTVDVQLVLPILFGQFIYPFVGQAGQRWMFGADLSQPRFAARLRAELLRSADLLLGLEPERAAVTGHQRGTKRAR